jgi:hypothetical protein
MPNGVRRQMRPAGATPFDDLAAEAHQFSDDVALNSEFADEDELLDEDHVEDEEGQEHHDDQIGEFFV